MNHSYVRKCEEYLQNIPSQKLPSQQQRATTAAATTGSRNLSSRKSLQKPMSGVREKQPINNPGAGGADLAVAAGRGKKITNPGQQQKQQSSKFIRPCCRQQQQQQQPQQQQHNRAASGGRNSLLGGGSAAGRKGKTSDNVNQLDNMKLVPAQPDGDYDGRAAAGMGPRLEVGDGIKLQQQNMKSGTESWDGILTSCSSFAKETATSLSQIKSKNASDHISSPIIPPGPTSTPAVSSASSASLSTRPTSSIAAIPPQPRRPSATTAPVPPVSSQRVPMCKSSELETGINLFRFDPLRTLQFLTLELKSKLKALGGSTGSEHKQLYKISKELLLAVRILTENWNEAQKSSENCKHCEKHPSVNALNANPVVMECQTCLKLQNQLIQENERHSHDTDQLNKEINYLKARLLTQLDTKESKASTEQLPQPQPEPPEVCCQAMVTDQLEQRLEGEIKRLQTMISDKQTLEDGLITDLNRKLQEATSRCRRLEHTRNEAEKRLLYATLENERLNFLLSTQASTMSNLQSDFNVIENLAHQQIDLLEDRTRSPPNSTRTSATRPCNNKTSNPIITIIDNHHRNYRHSSGGNPSPSASDDCCSGSGNSNSNQQPFSSRRRHHHHQQSPNADTTITSTSSSEQEKPDAYAVAVEKLRKQKRHYSFKNIAEKESDDGNDANDLKPSNPPPSTLRAATKALFGGSFRGSGTGAAFPHEQHDDHEMNVHCKAADASVAARGSRSSTGKTGTPFKPPALQFSLMGSLSASADHRFGASPARRTILIDSDCELSLPERERPIDDNHDNGGGNQTYAVTNPAAKKRFPLADGPTATSSADDDDVGGIGSSKTNNDCASRRPRRHMGRQVLAADRGRPSPSKGKKDNDDDDNAVDAVVEKYPRDYGDKFERRESCLLQSEKELFQNRPIIGQIRQGNSSSDDMEAGNHPKKDAKVSEGRKTISAANEPASARTTEEFSIDFDDITLPSSPAPFRSGYLSSIAGDLALNDD